MWKDWARRRSSSPQHTALSLEISGYYRYPKGGHVISRNSCRNSSTSTACSAHGNLGILKSGEELGSDPNKLGTNSLATVLFRLLATGQ